MAGMARKKSIDIVSELMYTIADTMSDCFQTAAEKGSRRRRHGIEKLADSLGINAIRFWEKELK